MGDDGNSEGGRSPSPESDGIEPTRTASGTLSPPHSGCGLGPPGHSRKAGPGSRLDGGRYRLISTLAAGGMGTVYLADDTRLDRQVAVKLVDRGTWPGPAPGASDEALITASVEHENVVTVFDTGQIHGMPWIAMEYVPGPTLRAMLDASQRDPQRTPPPTPREALEYARQTARALAAAHASTIVHHDLKPSNILLPHDRPLKVVDFGLSVKLKTQDRPCGGGTRGYRAPEQRRRGSPTPAIDIWALGLLIPEMLGAGRPREAHIDDHRRAPALDRLPPSVGRLVRDALRTDPARRPTAEAAVRVLEEALELLTVAEQSGQLEAHRALWTMTNTLLTRRRGGVVVVEGQPDSGKSALLRALCRQATAARAGLLLGRGRMEGRHGSFGPWREILRDAIARATDGTAEDLAARLPERLRHRLPLIQPVVPLDGGLAEQPTLDEPVRAGATRELLHGVLTACTDRPTLILIEDAQWMDSASWHLVEQFAAAEPPQPHLVVVFTQVMTPRPAGYERLLRSARLVKMAPVAARHVSRPVEVPSGFTPLAGIELTPSMTRTLGRLAVAGLRVPPGLVDALGIDEAAVQPLIDLGGLGQVDGDLIFRDKALHDELRQGLAPTTRARAHTLVADWLAGRSARTAPELAEIAHHRLKAFRLHLGAEQEAAREALLTAAAAAGLATLRAGAWPEAILWLEVCVRNKPVRRSWSAPPIEILEWYRHLADAAHGRGDVGARAGYGTRALALLGREPPAGRVGLALHVAFGVLRLLVPPLRMRNAIQRRAARLASLALGDRAVRHWFDNDRLAMGHALIWGLLEARYAGPSPELARARLEMGAAIGFAGRPRLARRFIAPALRWAEGADAPSIEAYGHLIDALIHVGRCGWSTVEQRALACQRVSDRINDARGWCSAQVVRFWAAHYRGRVETARALADALLQRAARNGHEQHQAWGHHSLSIVSLRTGRPADAREGLTRALELVGENGPRVQRFQLYGTRALACCRMGDTRRAGEDVARALELADTLGPPAAHALLESYAALVEVLLEALAADWSRRTRRGWQRDLRRALRLLRRYARAFPVGQARYALLRGRALLQRGRRRAAARSFERARHAAHRRGQRFEERQAQAALKRPEGDPVDAHAPTLEVRAPKPALPTPRISLNVLTASAPHSSGHMDG